MRSERRENNEKRAQEVLNLHIPKLRELAGREASGNTWGSEGLRVLYQKSLLSAARDHIQLFFSSFPFFFKHSFVVFHLEMRHTISGFERRGK